MDGSSSDMPMTTTSRMSVRLSASHAVSVVTVHQPCIAVGRVDPAVNIAKGAEPVDANPHILCSGFPAMQFLYSMEREHFRCFGNLAFFQRASPVPSAGVSVKVILERAGKFSGSREACLKGDIRDAL